ncbi:hypothetical protein [Mariniluteicoccus flavus]
MTAFWRDTDRSAVPVQVAISEWALAAWDVLEAIAGRWNKTVTEDDLGSEVQRRSGIATSTPTDSWIGPVLSLVAQRSHESRGPALVSLVVDEAGHPVPAFREALGLEGRSALGAADLAEQARETRLSCHRAYGAKIPRGAAEAAPRTPRATKAAAAPAKPPNPQRAMCPKCFLEVPVTGVCDNCD